MKKIILTSIISIIVLGLSIVLISIYSVEYYSKDKTFSDILKIPENKVGLVLGTSKYAPDGRLNLYFLYRIEATLQLYQANKIKYILISGDNSNSNYDEPTQFQQSLIDKGIPKNKIYLDYAGFRTLDSVIRAREIFGQDKITIISQEFHNKRAIYLAHMHDIDAIGYNAKDVFGTAGTKVKLREILAKIRAFIDIMIGTQPKFLGDKIEIN